jgi:hypothetical protein
MTEAMELSRTNPKNRSTRQHGAIGINNAWAELLFMLTTVLWRPASSLRDLYGMMVLMSAWSRVDVLDDGSLRRFTDRIASRDSIGARCQCGRFCGSASRTSVVWQGVGVVGAAAGRACEANGGAVDVVVSTGRFVSAPPAATTGW